MKSSIVKLLSRFRGRVTAALLGCTIFIVTVAGSLAYFADRETSFVQFTTASFAKDGYTLTTDHPNEPFIANEDVLVKITEQSTKEEDVTSTLTMTVTWDSPDPDCNVFGNKNEISIKVGDQIIAISDENISNNGKSVTFDLPAQTLTKIGGAATRNLTLHIPDSLMGTGTLSYTYDKAVIQPVRGGFSAEYSNAELNATNPKHDFTVNVGWAASSNTTLENGKTLMGYLVKAAKAGKYTIEYRFEYDKTSSGMKDFTSNALPRWSSYKDKVVGITIPEGVSTVGDYCFTQFEGITELTLPESMTAIGESAFEGITISELTLPAKTVTFEKLSFGYINELTEITFNAGKDTTVNFTADAGKDSGAFYVYPYVETDIIGENEDALAYDWIKDLRNPPTLAPSNSWIESDNISMWSNPITKVYFVTEYTPTGSETEVWNGAEDRNGDGKNDDDIICYLNGTELTIYANTATKIFANEISYNAFYGFNQTTGYDNIEMLDTSKAVDLSGMFSNNYVVTDLEVGHFDTSNAIDISSMFYMCYDVPALDVSKWDTGKVESMNATFSDCRALSNLNGIRNWDTRNVTTTRSMFDGAVSLESLDLSTKKVTLDGKEPYDSWDTRSLENMNSMFGNTDSDPHAMKELNISTFDTRNVTTLKLAFERCFSLESLDVTPREISLNGSEPFYTWDTGKVEIMNATFRNCSSLTELDLSGWDTSAVGTGDYAGEDDFNEMFMGCTALKTLNVTRTPMSINNKSYTSWNTSNAIYMVSMFEGCSSLRSLNLKDWTNTAAETMFCMFADCYGLTSINLTNFTTPALDNASMMFYDCRELTAIDVTSFDTSNTRDMSYMFYNCGKITSLDLRNLVTTSIIYAKKLNSFASGCTELKTIILNDDFGQSSSLIPAAGSSNGMFYVADHVDTKVVDANSVMRGYNWETDHRAAELLQVGIKVANQPNKTEYKPGEAFSTDGMVVTYVNVDGTKEVITNYTVSPSGALTADVTEVTISYEKDGKTYSVKVPITVKDPAIFTTNGNGTITGLTDYGETLSEITIPAKIGDETITAIGTYAFGSCSNLTSDLVIPDSVSSIGDYAFSGTDLTSVDFGSGVRSIGMCAFADCVNLTSVDLRNVTTISDLAFAGSGLTSVTIPDSVTSLGGEVFSVCTSLTSVEIGSGVKSIGMGTFWDCTALTSVTIPASVTNIGNYAFSGCSSLASIKFEHTRSDTLSIVGTTTVFGLTSNLDTTVIVPDASAIHSAIKGYNWTGSNRKVTFMGVPIASWNISKTDSDNVMAYLYDDPNNAGKYTLSIEGTGKMMDWTGSETDGMHSDDCKTNITEIKFSGAIENIGDYAFLNFTGLTGDLIMPDSMTDIGDAAFSYCTGIANVDLNQVETIGRWAFLSNSGLKNVSLGSVRNIGDAAFSYCTGLTTIALSNVETIGKGAFVECTGLAGDLVIPASVKSIGTTAFGNCSGLTRIYFEHSPSDSLELPTATVDQYGIVWTGAFYVKSTTSATPVATTVVANHDAVTEYGWEVDRRDVNFVSPIASRNISASGSNNVMAVLHNDPNSTAGDIFSIEGTGAMMSRSSGDTSVQPVDTPVADPLQTPAEPSTEACAKEPATPKQEIVTNPALKQMDLTYVVSADTNGNIALSASGPEYIDRVNADDMELGENWSGNDQVVFEKVVIAEQNTALDPVDNAEQSHSEPTRPEVPADSQTPAADTPAASDDTQP